MNLIKNARIVTMNKSGDVIEGGFVVFDDRIRGMGTDTGDMGEYDIDSVIDARGMYLIPGLVDAHCHIGMFE
ncbi:MAG: hypothetical protein J1F64_10075, partial [Oscillospiraceae bacterium]|nr:hypothetical protein [Oscillospiraceae bacterium]